MSSVEAPQGPSDEFRQVDIQLSPEACLLHWDAADAACLAKLDEDSRADLAQTLGMFACLSVAAAARGEVGALASAVRAAMHPAPRSSRTLS